MHLSERVKAITPSSTLAITAKSKAMRAAGIDVIGFGAGEPDFDTPDHIKRAAAESLAAGNTKYAPVPGTPEARAAVAGYMNRRHGYSYDELNVLISSGGKHSLYLAFQAVCNPGDEVLLPAPYWVSYPEQAKLAGATVREVHAPIEQGFKITPEQLDEAIGPKSRVLVLNSPSNPTGTMYSPGELAALAEVVAQHPRLVVFSDEIYERLVYGSHPFASFGRVNAKVEPQTVIFSGLSKTFAMTGWRVGFTIGPEPLIKAMAAMQSQMTSSITSFCLPAVKAALDGPQEPVEEMVRVFKERANRMHSGLEKLSGVRCPKPDGAFYVFPNIEAAAYGKVDPEGKTIESSADFAASLLEHARVAVVPGEDFSGPGHVRLSFATSMEQIEIGLERVAEFLGRLQSH